MDDLTLLAYLDPGTGSIVLQVVLSSAFAAMLFFKQLAGIGRRMIGKVIRLGRAQESVVEPSPQVDLDTIVRAKENAASQAEHETPIPVEVD